MKDRKCQRGIEMFCMVTRTGLLKMRFEYRPAERNLYSHAYIAGIQFY